MEPIGLLTDAAASTAEQLPVHALAVAIAARLQQCGRRRHGRLRFAGLGGAER